MSIKGIIFIYTMLFACSLAMAKIDVSIETKFDINESNISDIFIQTQYVSNYLDSLRQYLKKGPEKKPNFYLGNITLQEAKVFASSLQLKVDQLQFELTQIKKRTENNIFDNSYHEIHEILKATKNTLESVSNELGQKNIPVQKSKFKANIDNFVKLLQDSNQKIDQLLEHPVTLGHVFQQIISGINYSSSILESFNHISARIPKSKYKNTVVTNDSIFEQMLKSIALLNKVNDKLGYGSLKIIPANKDSRSIDESDLYNLSQLMTSKIKNIHRMKFSTKSIPISVYDNNISPTKIANYINILNQQLINILQVSKEKSYQFNLAKDGN